VNSIKYWFCFLVLFPFAVCASTEAVESLVQAEMSFAAMSVEKGRRTAFTTFLADDSILFRPGPVAGREWFIQAPESKGILNWRPAVAMISASGNFGYTTGPWQFYEQSMREPPVSNGQFLSFWRKDSDGLWKVVVDFGNMNPPPAADDSSVLKRQLQSTSVPCDMQTATETVLREDSAFATMTRENGTLKAFPLYLHESARLLRDNAHPAIGVEKIKEYLSLSAERLKWEPLAAGVSDSCDLAYTYGNGQLEIGQESQAAHYMRIWLREGETWKVAADLIVPDPPKP
jgi:ketosteroid isomerase-like protein